MSNSTRQSASETPSGQATHDGDPGIVSSESDSEQMTDRSLGFSENPLHGSEQSAGRITLTMLTVGVGVGLTCLLMWFWVEAAVIPDVGGIDAQIINGYTPFVYLALSAVAAPITAAVISIREGGRISSRRDVGVVSVGCLTGGVLLVLVAGVFVAGTGGGGESPVGPLDLVALAGLAGVVSALLAGALSLSTGE